MNVNRSNIEVEWIDPDDAPELTDDFFEEADEYVGEKLIRRGRQKDLGKGASAKVCFDNEDIAVPLV